MALLLPERLCGVTMGRPDLIAWHLPWCRKTVVCAALLSAQSMCTVDAMHYLSTAHAL